MSGDSRNFNQQSIRFKKQTPEYESVYKTFYAPLCFFACRILKDRPAAEDIVTEVFLKYWEKRFDFETVYKVKAFLYISTRNACLNYSNKSSYQSRAEETLHHEICRIIRAELNETVYRDILCQIHSLIDDLPERCKKVIQLTYINGVDILEVARKMQISKNTVRNQKNRGIKLIKDSDYFKSVKELWIALYDH